MNFVDTAIGDADIIIYVTDVYESSEKNREYVDKLNLLSVPVIVVINKIDKIEEASKLDELVEKWHGLVPKAEILPMSALTKFNTDILLNKIVSLLPQQPAWYDRDVFTDKNLRFFASEILREKILENYTKEIPYCTEVVIEQFKEEEEMYSIEAVLIDEGGHAIDRALRAVTALGLARGRGRRFGSGGGQHQRGAGKTQQKTAKAGGIWHGHEGNGRKG